MKAQVIDARSQVNRGRKGKAVVELVDTIRKYGLSYDEFIDACKDARSITLLERPKRMAINQPVPSVDDVTKFMGVVERLSPKDALMMKVMLYLGLRSVEVTRIKLSDIDLTPGAEKMMAHRKAGRDKVFVLPEKIASLMRMYVDANRNNVFLFEASYHKAYDPRSVRKKIQKYRESAGCGADIHAHNFRHMILTYLAGQGWTDSELQLISGHDSRESLTRYIYQNPEKIRTKLNGALAGMGV